jgi:hypothetical protein
MDVTMIALPNYHFGHDKVVWRTHVMGGVYHRRFVTGLSLDMNGLCEFIVRDNEHYKKLRFTYPNMPAVHPNASVLAATEHALRHMQKQTMPATIEFVSNLTLMRTLTDLAVILRRFRMNSSTRDILVSLVTMSNLFDSFQGERNDKISLVQTPFDFITVATTPYEEDESYRMKPLEVGQ